MGLVQRLRLLLVTSCIPLRSFSCRYALTVSWILRSLHNTRCYVRLPFRSLLWLRTFSRCTFMRATHAFFAFYYLAHGSRWLVRFLVSAALPRTRLHSSCSGSHCLSLRNSCLSLPPFQFTDQVPCVHLLSRSHALHSVYHTPGFGSIHRFAWLRWLGFFTRTLVSRVLVRRFNAARFATHYAWFGCLYLTRTFTFTTFPLIPFPHVRLDYHVHFVHLHIPLRLVTVRFRSLRCCIYGRFTPNVCAFTAPHYLGIPWVYRVPADCLSRVPFASGLFLLRAFYTALHTLPTHSHLPRLPGSAVRSSRLRFSRSHPALLPRLSHAGSPRIALVLPRATFIRFHGFRFAHFTGKLSRSLSFAPRSHRFIVHAFTVLHRFVHSVWFLSLALFALSVGGPLHLVCFGLVYVHGLVG